MTAAPARRGRKTCLWATNLRAIDSGRSEDASDESDKLDVLGRRDRCHVRGNVGRPCFRLWSSWSDGSEHGKRTPA